MKLLVILLCLFSERFLIHTISYQRFSWFGNYYLFIKKILDKSNHITNPWLVLAAIILPIILIAFIIYMLLHCVLFGFLALLMSIAIFFYCLGPQNAFYPLSAPDTDVSNEALVGNYLAKVNSQLFAVIFWYSVAGPIAALTYRLISLSKDITLVSSQSHQLTDILEWIPARITVLLYLLVGNFQRGFMLFTQFIFAKPKSNNQMLSECGLQAVRTNGSDEIPMPVAESLVEHATIVLLVLIALFTLVAWL